MGAGQNLCTSAHEDGFSLYFITSNYPALLCFFFVACQQRIDFLLLLADDGLFVCFLNLEYGILGVSIQPLVKHLHS